MNLLGTLLLVLLLFGGSGFGYYHSGYMGMGYGGGGTLLLIVVVVLLLGGRNKLN